MNRRVERLHGSQDCLGGRLPKLAQTVLIGGLYAVKTGEPAHWTWPVHDLGITLAEARRLCPWILQSNVPQHVADTVNGESEGGEPVGLRAGINSRSRSAEFIDQEANEPGLGAS